MRLIGKDRGSLVHKKVLTTKAATCVIGRRRLVF